MGFFANADVPVLIAFVIYLAVMLGIGFYFSNKSKKIATISWQAEASAAG